MAVFTLSEPFPLNSYSKHLAEDLLLPSSVFFVLQLSLQQITDLELLCIWNVFWTKVAFRRLKFLDLSQIPKTEIWLLGCDAVIWPIIQLLVLECGFQPSDSFIKIEELSHLFRSFGTQRICLLLLFMLLQIIVTITVVPINIS